MKYLLWPLALLACLAIPLPAAAHPHVWVDYYVDAAGTPDGIAKLKFKWHFDRMFTNMVQEDFNLKTITPKDSAFLRDKAFSNLRNYHYYTYITADGQAFEPKPKDIGDFAAKMNGKNLEYTFTITLPKPAKKVELSLYDTEFYVDIGPPMAGIDVDNVGIMSSGKQTPRDFITTSAESGGKPPSCAWHSGQTRVSAVWGEFPVYVVDCTAG